MRTRLIRLFLLAPLVLWPVGAWAQGGGYTVRDIEVSATASDGTTARMQALEQAEKAAFVKLLAQSMSAEEAQARADATPAHKISRMVRGYEVRDEKVGATSYTARLDVNFDAAQMRALLQPQSATGAPAAAVPAAQPAAAVPATASSALHRAAPNVLVLPVMVDDSGTPLLWEPGNRWREAWNAAERSDPQYIRLPLGDQSDRMVVDGADARQAAFGALSMIAERYQSSTVIVPVAQSTVASGVNALSVTLRTLTREGQVSETPVIYERLSGEGEEMAMQRAAQDIIGRIMHEAQQRAHAARVAAATTTATTTTTTTRATPEAAPYAPRSRITVLSRLERLNDWVGLRNRLTALPSVERVDLAAISSKQVDLVVHYRGSPAQLETEMQSGGMRVQKATNFWIVGL